MTFTKTIGAALQTSGLGLALLVALAAVPNAFGQDFAKAKVPFAFQVGDKTLPAGAYEFKVDRTSESVLVSGGQPRTGAEALFMTTMAARPHAKEETLVHVVFDKVGTTYTLSEIWIPGSDGILIHATKGPHEHHILRLKR